MNDWKAKELRKHLTHDWKSTTVLRNRLEDRIGLPVTFNDMIGALNTLESQGIAVRRPCGHGTEWKLNQHERTV